MYNVIILNLKEGAYMGFKSVELQIAIPRSQDAGKMQEQMMKQGQQFQETLTNNNLREALLKRKQVNEYDAVEKQTVKKEDAHHQLQDEHQGVGNEKSAELMEPDHPYLGNHVDFSG